MLLLLLQLLLLLYDSDYADDDDNYYEVLLMLLLPLLPAAAATICRVAGWCQNQACGADWPLFCELLEHWALTRRTGLVRVDAASQPTN